MLPSAVGTPAPEGAESTGRPVLTHAETLLRRLKHDPEILKIDPAGNPSVEGHYKKYLEGVDTTNAEWTAKIREVIAEASEDSDALLATKELLGEF